MNLTLIILVFLMVFAVTGLSLYTGMQHFEKKQRKQITGVLKSAGEIREEQTINVLRDAPKQSDRSLIQYLSTLNIVTKLEASLLQSGLNWTLKKLLGNMAKFAAIGIVVGMILPVNKVPMLGRCAILFCVFAYLPVFQVNRKKKKRLRGCEEQLPDALEFLARSMSAGHALSISLGMVGQELPDPLGFEFRKLAHEQNLGSPMELALKGFIARVPLLDIKFFASSVMMQRQTGGNLGEILMRLSRIIRERFQLRGKVRAVSAHGRLTALILGGLPVFTFLAMLVVAPGYMEGMANDPIGKKIIIAAVISQVIGNLVIRKIVDIDV
jgi:tight adherence protein B